MYFLDGLIFYAIYVEMVTRFLGRELEGVASGENSGCMMKRVLLGYLFNSIPK